MTAQPKRGRPKGTTRGRGGYLRMYADKALLSQFSMKAIHEGMTLSERLRYLVKRDVGRGGEP